MQDENLSVLILSTTAFFACLTGFIIYFVVLYRKRQIANKEEQERLMVEFQRELLKTQLEVQEQTLNYISTEIHDNITQVLSFVKLTLAGVAASAEGARKQKLVETRELVAQTITDLRDLSKSLSFEHITSLGLNRTIEMEVERINKSGLLDVSFVTEGEVYSLGEQRELVLFRIFQETLNNTLKHAAAKHLKILLQYQPDLFNLTLEDDGSGFSANTLENKTGSGLRNMENRAALIGGVAKIISAPGKGCCVAVVLNPLKQQFYTDGGTHPNRIS